MESKLSKLLRHMRAGEWEAAMQIAASFPDRGQRAAQKAGVAARDRDPIKDAWEACAAPSGRQNPKNAGRQAFYTKVTGKTLDQLWDDGITALKKRYPFWDEQDQPPK